MKGEATKQGGAGLEVFFFVFLVWRRKWVVRKLYPDHPFPPPP
jgi:hypothetical protein